MGCAWRAAPRRMPNLTGSCARPQPFNLTSAARPRRCRAPRRDAHAAWRRADAGVHAGRHAGRGQGRHPSRSARAWRCLATVSAPRSSSATPITSICGPGDALIARAGGLHRFIGWDRPILTDSGGYQVFSLAERRRISEDGAEFRSHLDGSLHLLTPERATDIQAQLGSDIAMVLDECIATPASDEATRVAMERSVRWAARSRAGGSGFTTTRPRCPRSS